MGGALNDQGLSLFDLSDSQNKTLLGEFLYWSMVNYPEIYWLYYGHAATGGFLGFRRPTAEELKVAGVNSTTLIRTECKGAESPFIIHNLRSSSVIDNTRVSLECAFRRTSA